MRIALPPLDADVSDISTSAVSVAVGDGIFFREIPE